MKKSHELEPLPRPPSETRPLPLHLVELRHAMAAIKAKTEPLAARAAEFQRMKGIPLPLPREDATGKRVRLENQARTRQVTR